MHRMVLGTALALGSLACNQNRDKPSEPETENGPQTVIPHSEPPTARRDAQTSAAEKSLAAPFTIENGGEEYVYAEACLMNIAPAWVAMVPLEDRGACDVTGEDDFAMSLSFEMCSQHPCALPAPGQKLDGTIYVVKPPSFEGPATIEVVRHQKPMIVVRVYAEGGDDGAFTSIAGEMSIKVSDDRLVSPGSWK